MRPTKLVANSQKSFLDAAQKLIGIALSSANVKKIRIMEDAPKAGRSDSSYRLRGHIIKRD